jgi:hypothetical protein
MALKIVCTSVVVVVFDQLPIDLGAVRLLLNDIAVRAAEGFELNQELAYAWQVSLAATADEPKVHWYDPRRC